MDNKCYTSDTGNSNDVQVGNHKFNKEGYCLRCGMFNFNKDKLEHIIDDLIDEHINTYNGWNWKNGNNRQFLSKLKPYLIKKG